MLDIEGSLDTDERSAVDFVAEIRSQWSRVVYPALVDQAARRAAKPKDLQEATSLLHDLPLYPWFSHLERQQQKMSWRIAGDAVLRRRAEWQDELTNVPARTATLTLDPNLSLPSWYLDIDIHVQPGATYFDDASALMYEMGARVVMLRDNDGYKFHRLFTVTSLPEVLNAERIVDLGCGFGKSTQSLVSRYPGAQIVGVDMSAPNLRLAQANAERKGLPIDFVQAAAYETGIESESADLVTGTMLLHELPTELIAETLREAARLVKPGGTIAFLEFDSTGDPFRDSTIYEHAERNNEPFFRDLFGFDAVRFLESEGLVCTGWAPFDEREQGLLAGPRPERPEWYFPWAVISALKPSSERADRESE